MCIGADGARFSPGDVVRLVPCRPRSVWMMAFLWINRPVRSRPEKIRARAPCSSFVYSGGPRFFFKLVAGDTLFFRFFFGGTHPIDAQPVTLSARAVKTRSGLHLGAGATEEKKQGRTGGVVDSPWPENMQTAARVGWARRAHGAHGACARVGGNLHFLLLELLDLPFVEPATLNAEGVRELLLGRCSRSR